MGLDEAGERTFNQAMTRLALTIRSITSMRMSMRRHSRVDRGAF